MTLHRYNAAQYTITFEDDDCQCIAPRVDGTRCRSTHSRADMQEMRSWMKRAEPSGYEQAAFALKNVVWFRACDFAHRKFLNYFTVWQDVADEYLKRFMDVYDNSGILTPPLTPPNRLSARLEHREAGPVSQNRYETRSTGLQLRPPTFTRYPKDRNFTIKEALAKIIQKDKEPMGVVYIFTWPSHPGYVKIGFSGKSVQSRFDRWSRCHDGLQKLRDKRVTFPAIVEALIHRELWQYRREIVCCQSCHIGHNEWFQISADTAINTMEAWVATFEREMLYNNGDQVLQRWLAANLMENTNDYSIAYVTSVLDEEERRRAEQARRKQQAEFAEQLRVPQEEPRQLNIALKAERQAEQTRQAELAEQDRQAQLAQQAQQAKLAEQACQTQSAEQNRQTEITEQTRLAQLAEQSRLARVVVGGSEQARVSEEDRMLSKIQQAQSLEHAAQQAATKPRVSDIEEPVRANSSDQAHVVVPDALQPIAIVRQSTTSTADVASRDEVISPSEPISVRPTDLPAAQRENTGLPTPASSPQRQPEAVKSDDFASRFSSLVVADASRQLALPHPSKLPKATEDESEEQTTSGKAISTAPSPSAEKITPATPVKLKVSLPPTPPETPLYRKSAPEGNGSGPEALAVHQGEPSRPTTPVPPLPKADKDPFAGSTMNQLAKTAATTTTTTTTTAQASEFVLAVPSVVVP
ncbi:uncharacterized protein K489DRAFT_383032 [Dissoconium aciculare CBS 342.82]|uniref:Bacteriophage T5 Orf172 DNA-binding domain-containing protein n=1 Tax=Dissoconium aciculare CBS 342.82 TaxID=1314786 RepID=A0A6J3LWW5_9PEZI|nr:uncharacterized protein K489DRAFT_383032 [Dissoconium aciculare CBS 342.82]KAF1820246.1 hypothetical protein K489DRAFT_383032 [Dissoconium aciculare CBS 342.82]